MLLLPTCLYLRFSLFVTPRASQSKDAVNSDSSAKHQRFNSLYTHTSMGGFKLKKDLLPGNNKTIVKDQHLTPARVPKQPIR